MTTLIEMAIAYEQARTAPDVTDRATGLEEADRIGGVKVVCDRLLGEGAEFCADCDDPIPEARREAYPSAVCCVDCQSLREGRRHG